MRVKTGFKLLPVVGTVMAGGLIAATPLVASAEEAVDVDVFSFVGQTDVLSPVQLVGGSGWYAFHSIVCAGVSVEADAAAVVPEIPEVGPCVITSSGTYVNIVFGTGAAAAPNPAASTAT